MNQQPLNVLVVDDSEMNLKYLGVILKRAGYFVQCAHSGHEALELVDSFRPDIILMDVMMPEMDGYETTQRIQQIRGMKDVPVLFITALDSQEDRLRTFDVGGVDHIAKPFHPQEMIARVNAHGGLYKTFSQLQETMRLLNNDIRAASILQQSLMLDRHFYQSPFWLQYDHHACAGLAGDNVGYHMIGGSLVFYVIDVVGHGVTAAMISTLISLEMDKIFHDDPQELRDIPMVIQRLDRFLSRQFAATDPFYSTMIYCVMEEDGKVQFVSAGHPDPIIYRKHLAKAELIRSKEMVPIVGVNLLPDHFSSETCQLSDGDAIFLYTDGIIEQKNPEGNEFGIQRLIQTISERGSRQTLDSYVDEVRMFSKKEGFDDDVTLCKVVYAQEGG